MEREEQAFILQKMGTAALYNSLPFFRQVLSHLITPPDLPQISSCLQTVMICVPARSFLVLNTRKPVPNRAMGMRMIFITRSMRALMPAHANTGAWLCAYKPCGFHPCGQVRDHIPSPKHMATPSNESPLSSASTALGYSSFHALPNGFSNAGTWFLSRLDRHFPLCSEMEIRHWVVFWWCAVERFCIQSRNIFPELVRRGQMWCFVHIFTSSQTTVVKATLKYVVLTWGVFVCVCFLVYSYIEQWSTYIQKLPQTGLEYNFWGSYNISEGSLYNLFSYNVD